MTSSTPNKQLRYRITLAGHVSPAWSDWFDGLPIHHHPDGYTLIEGAIPDHATLHGLLNRVRDLGLQLIAVEPLCK